MKNTIIFILAIMLNTGLLLAEGYKVGDKATDFTLKNVDGSMVSASDYENAKCFIIIFTCNHCPYSKMYEDRIIELDKKFKDQGYPVIAINSNDAVKQPQDSYENMQARAKDKGFTFPYLYDETQEYAHAYGATRTPHVFVLEKEDSDLIVKYIGAIDNSARIAENASEKYVEDAVEALLAGKDPEVTNVKAIGCTIKWKE